LGSWKIDIVYFLQTKYEQLAATAILPGRKLGRRMSQRSNSSGLHDLFPTVAFSPLFRRWAFRQPVSPGLFLPAFSVLPGMAQRRAAQGGHYYA
jgi:hypothetical protein